jgi:hypothetical protein
MKLTFHCDPEYNNHKECNGKVIEDERTFDCECWCHDKKLVDASIAAKVPPLYYGGWGGSY